MEDAPDRSKLSAAAPVGPAGPRRFLSALRHRNYRLLWTGTLVSNTGDWLDQVALNWLIIEQTGSAVALGLVNLCRALPILTLTLVAGALNDRMERRRLLIMVQAAAMVLATVLAVMAFTGNAPVWALMLIAAGRGCIVAFSLPTRHSLIPKLVPREELPNAVALNAVTMNLTKTIGPLLAGAIIAGFGTAACFAVNALSYVAVLATLAAMRFPAEVTAPRTAETLVASIGAGLRFVATQRTLLLLVMISLVPVFLGQPFVTLLAVYVHDATSWGPMGLGILTSAAGLGSVIGALAIAGFPDTMRRGRTLLVLLLGFALSLFAFAVNPVTIIAPMLVLSAGALYMCYNATLNTIMQLTVVEEYRGRVMSVMFLNRGLIPLGTACAAILSSAIGIQATYAAMAILIFLFAASIMVLSPRIRQLRA